MFLERIYVILENSENYEYTPTGIWVVKGRFQVKFRNSKIAAYSFKRFFVQRQKKRITYENLYKNGQALRTLLALHFPTPYINGLLFTRQLESGENV